MPKAFNSVKVIRVDQIRIPNVQRGKKRNRIDKIKNSFCVDKFGVPTVSKRKRSKYYYVIEGQQRLTALKELHKEGKYLKLMYVNCHYFASEGDQKEADIYLGISNERTSLTTLEKFNAKLLRKDQEAIALREIIKNRGLELKQGAVTWPEISCVGSLEKIFNKLGEFHVEEVLSCLCGAWEEGIYKDDALKQTTVSGASHLIWCCRDQEANLDLALLAEKLSYVSPKMISARAKEKASTLAMSGSRHKVVASGMLEIYNKGLNGGKLGVDLGF